METLQAIQQLDPATIIVALSSLPWIAAILMLAVGAATRSVLDDDWEMRAGAAVRWADAAVTPVRGHEPAAARFAAPQVAHSGRPMFGVPDLFPHAA